MKELNGGLPPKKRGNRPERLNQGGHCEMLWRPFDVVLVAKG